ncbi:MAG: transporter substrate-binding domain-containing protein, partial [Opitutales bacterium]
MHRLLLTRKSYGLRVKACFIYLTLGGAFASGAAAQPLRVGIESYEPYSFVDQTGQPSGFTVDLLKAIARRENLEIEFVAEPWEKVLEDFKAGRISILANVGYTKARTAYIDFTIAHSNLPAGVFVRRDLARPASLEELRGKRFAATRNALVYEWLQRNQWTTEIVTARNTHDCLLVVNAGQADAVICSRLVAAKYIRDEAMRNLVLTDFAVPGFDYKYHFGVHRGDAELLYRLNDGMAELYASGEYSRIYEKWLGPLEPRPLRLRELLPYLVPTALILLVVLGALLRQRRLLGRLAQQAAALRLSEERYRQFFEEDLASAFIANPEGRILACNPAFAHLFGYATPASALGGNIFELFLNPADQAELLEVLRRHQHLQNVKLELHRRDGTPVHVVTNAFGKCDEQGALLEIKGYMIDHTESRRLEDQLRQSQKMEAVGQLAGGVAHDFNNLLTAILGYSNLMLDEPGLDQSTRGFAAEIRNAAQRAAALTRQLLAFSRKELVQPQVLSPRQVVENLEKMLRRLIGEDVVMSLDLDRASGNIRIDPGQFEQVIVNLVVNACDAMPLGGRLGLELANVVLDEQGTRDLLNVQPGAYLCLTITDTGCGMAPEVQERIFEPFFTTKGLGKGTGLGLAMVYGIVKENGGHIAVSSEPGLGSVFRLYFPQVSAAPAEAAAGQAAAADDLRGTETVLLVEDNEAVRKVTRQILHEYGYAVVDADGGPEALRLFAAQPGFFDLVLSDLIMPEMNGLVLAERIRAQAPAQRVLFMSGYADDKLRRQGGLTADTPVVDKPFTPHVLMRKVREAL